MSGTISRSDLWQNVCLINVNHLLDLAFGLNGHLGKINVILLTPTGVNAILRP